MNNTINNHSRSPINISDDSNDNNVITGIHLSDNDNTSDYSPYNRSESYDDIMTLYRFRSIPFSVLAVTGLLFNLLSLLVIVRIRGQRTVYHALLANLAAGDALGSILMWLYHNSVLLYPDFGDEEDRRSLKICLLKSAGLLVPLLLAMINSALALLMLSINQFIAICYPLFSQTRLPHEKAWLVILAAWVISTCSSFVPVIAVLVQAYMDDCSIKIQYKTNTSLEICAYMLAALILTVIFLYVRIYKEVIRCRKRTLELSMTSRRVNNLCTQQDHSSAGRRTVSSRLISQKNTTKSEAGNETESRLIKNRNTEFTQKEESSNKRHKFFQGRSMTSNSLNFNLQTGGPIAATGRLLPVDSPETNYKAFVTTILLTGTLLFFWIPYLLVSSLSIYFSDSDVEEYPDFLINLKFHAIDFLPLLTYLTDPIVYGVRIRCVRLSYKRLFGSLASFVSCRKKMERRRNYDVEGTMISRHPSIPMTNVNEFSVCE